MRGETGQLVARVEVDSVEVEEGGVDEEEQVDVARHQEGDDEQRRGSEKLEGKYIGIYFVRFVDFRL